MHRRTFAIVGMLITAAAPASAETIDYAVVRGDTCKGLSLKFWGDPMRYDKLHELNPQMGPEPHTLVPGTILKVNKLGPEAKVTFVRNSVEAATPAPHPAARNEPLMKGHKVSTLGNSNAEVTFNDATKLQLGEHTLVVILGGTRSAAARTAEDTTLVRGTLSAFLKDVGGKAPPLKVATPSSRVDLTSGGHSKVYVDDAATTRLAVYQGRSSITAVGKKVEVDAGFGSKAENGKAPTPPRPLPVAPAWGKLPPTIALTVGPDAEIAGTYGAGAGGPQVSAWHVQLSRDEEFNDLVLDANVGVEILELQAKKLVDGAYFARVSGIDADRFEGPYSPVAQVRVVQPKVTPATAGKLGAIDVGAGLFCAVDDRPRVAVSAPILLAPAETHVLTCATTESGAQVAALKLGVEVSGQAVVVAEPGALTEDARGKRRVVKIKLSDAVGAPVSGAKLVAGDAAGVLVESPSASSDLGTYTAVVRWKGDVSMTTLHFVINGVQPFEVQLPASESRRPIAPVVKREPPHRYEAAVLGVAQVQSKLGLGIGAELGLRGPLWKGAYGVALRLSYEHHADDAAHTSTSALVAGLPLQLRLRPVGSSWFPYLSISPQLVIDRLTETKSGGLTSTGHFTDDKTQTDWAARAALTGALGVQGGTDSGGVFLEVGYRAATSHEGRRGDATFDGFLGTAGFRFGL